MHLFAGDEQRGRHLDRSAEPHPDGHHGRQLPVQRMRPHGACQTGLLGRSAYRAGPDVPSDGPNTVERRFADVPDAPARSSRRNFWRTILADRRTAALMVRKWLDGGCEFASSRTSHRHRPSGPGGLNGTVRPERVGQSGETTGLFGPAEVQSNHALCLFVRRYLARRGQCYACRRSFLCPEPLSQRRRTSTPSRPSTGKDAKDGKKVDEFVEAEKVLGGPAANPECMWLGRRVVSLLWRDDLDTAFRHLDLYDRFGCPSGHIQVAFRCVVRQGNIDPKAADSKAPDSLNARISACWLNPNVEAAGAAPTGSAAASAAQAAQ